LVTTERVGLDPVALLDDPATGYVYVASAGSDTLTVLGPSGPVGSISVGALPIALALNGSTGAVYIANELSLNVTVLSGLAVLGSVPIPGAPSAAVVDPTDGVAYVADAAAGTVSLLRNGQLQATVAVGTDPSAVAFDPASGNVYVANEGSSNVSILSASRVLGTVAVGAGPDALVYDPGDRSMYVLDGAAGAVTVLNSSEGAATVPVGTDPSAGVYDPVDSAVYVVNEGSQNVSVLVGSQVEATLAVGTAPGTPAIDPVRGLVYVPNSGSANVSLLEGSERVGSVSVGQGPVAAVYDAASSTVAVLNSGSGNASLLAGTRAIGEIPLGSMAPSAAAYDPAVGALVVVGTGGRAALLGAFSVLGWLNVTASPAPPVYLGARGEVLVPDPGASTATVLAPSALVITFEQDDLPGGENWSAEVGGANVTTNGKSLAFTETVGVYDFVVTGPAHYVAIATPPSPVELLDEAVAVELTFVPVTPHPVTFQERGLPNGTRWCVTLGSPACSSNATVVFPAVDPGRHPYTVGPLPGYSDRNRGNVTVAGAALTKTVRFTRLTYALTFEETGLPHGHRWRVTAGPTSRGNNGPKITFHLGNGTAAYSVRPIAGWTMVNGTGTYDVNGTPVTIDIAFVRVTYAVNFSETGLPNGTNWSVVVHGSTFWSDGSSELNLSLPNGTYRYHVGSVTGYRASGAPSVLRVRAGPAGVTLRYRPIPGPALGPTLAGAAGLPIGGILSGLAVPRARRPPVRRGERTLP
jgi:DNA-binding beta-propeller fold protein YncE